MSFINGLVLEVTTCSVGVNSMRLKRTLCEFGRYPRVGAVRLVSVRKGRVYGYSGSRPRPRALYDGSTGHYLSLPTSSSRTPPVAPSVSLDISDDDPSRPRFRGGTGRLEVVRSSGVKDIV